MEIYNGYEYIYTKESKINKINTSSYFFKTKLEYPILLAPMGHQTQIHKNGEIETLKYE